MTPAVEQAMVCKDTAGGDQVFDQLWVRWPGRSGRRLCRGSRDPKGSECGHKQHAADMLQPACHDKLQRWEGLWLELGVPVEVVEPAFMQVVRRKQAAIAVQVMHRRLERHLRRPHFR